MCCNKSLHKQHNIVFFQGRTVLFSETASFKKKKKKFIFIASKADRYCNDCLTLI